MYKKIFTYYVNGNFHVAIAVASLAFITGSLFDVEVRKEAFFLALSTFVSYNFIRYLKYRAKELRKEVYVWFCTNLKSLLWMNGVASLGLVYCLTTMTSSQFTFLLPFLILTGFYMLPVRVNKQKITLRRIPGLKIFSIAVSWSGLTSLFLLYSKGVSLGSVHWLFFVQQLVFVFALTLPFDIRDMNFDAKELFTIPTVFGLRIAKFLGVVATFVFVCLGSFTVAGEAFLTILFAGFLLLLSLLFAQKKQSPYYASFWVEGIPIVWWGLLNLL